MAKVLESLSVPLSCGTRSSLSGPVLCHKSLLPAFNGLRIQTRAHRLTLASSSSSRRRISATTTTRAFPRGIVCEAQDTAVDVAAVTDATWKSLVLENDLPTLVEFWAPWCGPCRMIHPIIDELSKQYAGKLKCLKLNTDESPSVATQYGIRSIPTVMIFKSGEKKDTIIGAVPKSTLTASIDKFL